MSETNAERLVEINEYYAHFLTRDNGTDYVLVSDLKWLIKQAERVPKLELNFKSLQQEWVNTVKENKRLREALEVSE